MSSTIPLVTLPLRPSTLTALIRSGFSTTGDVMNSCRKDLTSAADANQAGDGNASKGDEHASSNATGTKDGNNSFGHFAEAIGCSSSQAADYAHEIDNALSSVGLPRLLTPNENDADIDGESGGTAYHGTGSHNNIMAPHSSIFPATAASILRSKASSHFPTSNDNHNHTAAVRQIISFSQSLDVLLGGGFALSELTEISGLPGVGKTQLAMQLCVDSRLPANYGGVEGHAVVIDAEGSWSCAAGGDRLWAMSTALVDHVKSSASRKLAARRKREGSVASISEDEINSLLPTWLTAESILEGIHIFRVHDEASQTCTLYNLPKFLLELEQKGTPAKIVVIDSLAFHYRVASSSSSIVNGSKKNNSLSTTHNLTRMAAFLIEIASEFDLAVVAMNHLTTRIEKDGNNSQGGTKLVPALGESWAHSVTSRLMIDHYRPFHTDTSSSTDTHMDEVRTCTLVKSPHKPTGTALFMITDKGIRGVPPQMLQPQSAKRARQH
eukprot:CAMPEP_0181078316 /NCGR_PEP_ID=MMETSP1071-20121207/1418_1 /TAXON_ID=35127 /ORGANISM="Thalassiosira sp., Strain NH16" /LENGTH=495 /DNA_ID=CAMNT_0023159617 /DNA_START=303 /DNA_END=1790 /DNA_ORIENTATION=-